MNVFDILIFSISGPSSKASDVAKNSPAKTNESKPNESQRNSQIPESNQTQTHHTDLSTNESIYATVLKKNKANASKSPIPTDSKEKIYATVNKTSSTQVKEKIYATVNKDKKTSALHPTYTNTTLVPPQRKKNQVPSAKVRSTMDSSGESEDEDRIMSYKGVSSEGQPRLPNLLVKVTPPCLI